MDDFFNNPWVWLGFAFIGGFFIYDTQVGRDARNKHYEEKKKYLRENQRSIENIDPRPFPRRKQPIIEQILGLGFAFSVLGFIVYFFQQCS